MWAKSSPNFFSCTFSSTIDYEEFCVEDEIEKNVKLWVTLGVKLCYTTAKPKRSRWLRSLNKK